MYWTLYILDIINPRDVFFLILALMTLLSASTLPHHQNESIPQWIKKDARFWHDGKISEEEFVNSIKWSVENKIMGELIS